MFSATDFENKVYAFVTKEVNDTFSALPKGTSQQERFRMQGQMMKALHLVTEETIMQISYGLMLGRPPATLFKYGSHVFEKVILKDSITLLVCQHCKKIAMHNDKKEGEDFAKSVVELGKECNADNP